VRRFVVFVAVGFAILLGLYMAISFARAVGILPNCGEQEKAAIAEFPQYGGRVAGEDLHIEGDEVNCPPPHCWKTLRRGVRWRLRSRKHPRSRS
jgi:hypothetical protein